ncbi:MAG: heavy-metal-associated domain-containing protein [Verrucomicrobiales bacterium]|nr:heavy-metal-associated domain-containing protein [Verrucomicrobiales bacterium]
MRRTNQRMMGWMAMGLGAAMMGSWTADADADPGERRGASVATKPPLVVTANATNQFRIKGMHCDGCAKGIAAEVRMLRGVAAVDVSYAKKFAQVAYDTNQVTQVEMIRVIKEAGYEAVPTRNRKEARP